MLGKLVHYTADALMVSTVLAGIKHASGLTVDVNQISEPNVRNAMHYYLSAGEMLFDKARSYAQGSSYFRSADPLHSMPLFGHGHDQMSSMRSQQPYH